MKKKILIAGGSGLVGRRLSQVLTDEGFEVRWLSRKTENQPYPTFGWDLSEQTIDPLSFDNVDVIINLAGAGIADKRWTKKRKKLLIQSRTQSTNLLANYIDRLKLSPALFINASAVGYYGDRNEEWMDENSEPGSGFLSECCIVWENAVKTIKGNFPKAIIRIGVVLTPDGGALEKMLLPLKFKTNTFFGNGEQYMSWIHIDDLCRLFIHLIKNPAEGVFNAVADNPLKNIDMAKSVAKGTQTSAILLPAPVFGLRLAMGEMADVVLESTRVSNEKIKSHGFEFQFDDAATAIKDLTQD